MSTGYWILALLIWCRCYRSVQFRSNLKPNYQSGKPTYVFNLIFPGDVFPNLDKFSPNLIVAPANEETSHVIFRAAEKGGLSKHLHFAKPIL